VYLPILLGYIVFSSCRDVLYLTYTLTVVMTGLVLIADHSSLLVSGLWLAFTFDITEEYEIIVPYQLYISCEKKRELY